LEISQLECLRFWLSAISLVGFAQSWRVLSVRRRFRTRDVGWIELQANIFEHSFASPV
jgi:hypothetical protein